MAMKEESLLVLWGEREWQRSSLERLCAEARRRREDPQEGEPDATLDAAIAEACDELIAVERQIAETEASSVAGLMVQAMVLGDLVKDDGVDCPETRLARVIGAAARRLGSGAPLSASRWVEVVPRKLGERRTLRPYPPRVSMRRPHALTG